MTPPAEVIDLVSDSGDSDDDCVIIGETEHDRLLPPISSKSSTAGSISPRICLAASPKQSLPATHPSFRYSTTKSPLSQSTSFRSSPNTPSSSNSFISSSRTRSSTPASPLTIQHSLARELSKSTWDFPKSFSRSYSLVSEPEFAVSNGKERGSSKRKSTSFLRSDSESPAKRRNIDMSNHSEIQSIPSSSRRSSMASRHLTPKVDPDEIVEIDLEDEEGWLYNIDDIYRERSPTPVMGPPKSTTPRKNPTVPVRVGWAELGPIVHIDLEEEEGWIYNVDDIYRERAPTPGRELQKSIPKPRKKPIVPRNAHIDLPYALIETRIHNGMNLRAGQTVELVDGDFVQVKSIIENVQTGEAILRGWRLRRTFKMEGMLHCKLNEVCWLFEVDLDDPRLILEQSVEEIALGEIIKFRELRATNQKFPLCRFEKSELRNGEASKEWVYENSALVVRWRYITTFATAAERQTRKFRDRRMEFLREEECTESLGICDNVRRQIFNSSMISGGSSQAVEKHVTALRGFILDSDGESAFSRLDKRRGIHHDNYSLEDDMSTLSLDAQYQGQHQQSFKSSSPGRALVLSEEGAFESGGVLKGEVTAYHRRCKRKPGQMYTYGDFFSGAGGASRGAKLAGLQLVFALDFWPVANKSYMKNFPNTRLYQMFSHNFIMKMGGKASPEMYVDILHISPPCQYWSPAHTRPGKDDVRNMATLFSVLGLVMMVRPRIVTVEQTFGLHTPHFRLYFNAVVNTFTTLGYSVRWAIIQLANWGLPQTRKRLVMIAAAPGETLPEFPPFTHDKDGKNGLKRWVTINDVLRTIPADAANHDIQAATFTPDRIRPAYDGKQLAKTITCAGGSNYHPSGKRNFTLCEFAALQTFPQDHVFLGSYIKKQIGNAVPPKALAKVMFSHIRRHLEKFDGVVQQAYDLEA